MATDAALGVVPSVVIGTVAAVGGGLIRDLLADEVPQIFASGSQLYALPAAGGALLTTLGTMTSIGLGVVQSVAVALTVTLRLLAVKRGWHAPVPKWRPGDASR